jgi:plastocyanin
LKFVPWLVASFVLAAFPASAANVTVVVGADGDFNFTPRNVTINIGDSVTWQYAGGGLHAHSVVANNGSFRCAQGCDSGGGNGNAVAAAWSFTRTFTTAGTVDYNCEVHKNAGMIGSVIVNGASTFAIGPGITGAWYDPQQSGHGLFLEVLPDNRLLAWWFAFSPDGTQGSNHMDLSRLTLPAGLTCP